LDPPDEGRVYSFEDIAAFLDLHPTVRSVSSHQLRFPLSQVGRYRFHPIVFLRDPILRVQSIYEYERMDGRRDTSKLLHTVKANELSFADFVRWCLEDPLGAAPIANYQTRVCSLTLNGNRSDDWLKNLHFGNYLEAAEMLRASASVGVTEQFEVSCRKLESVLTPFFPSLKFENVVENSSRGGGVPVSRSVEGIRSELGDRLFHELCQANELDLLLHASFSRLLANNASAQRILEAVS